MAHVSMKARLAEYGLDAAHVHVADLQVAANTTHVLSARNTAVAQHHTLLKPRSVDDLRKWLRSPHHGAGPTRRVGTRLARNKIADFTKVADLTKPLPAHLTPQHHEALYAAAHQFIINDDHGLDAKVIANLDHWVIAIKPEISLFHYADIHVHTGATLQMTANSVLFARYITVDDGGQINAKVTVAKIDCAGFKGN